MFDSAISWKQKVHSKHTGDKVCTQVNWTKSEGKSINI